MNISFTSESIGLQKELNSLDSFTLDFIAALDKLSLRYVIVSGYVAILFGRSRASEDIDIILEKMDRQKFHTLWNSLKDGFECIITSSEDEAYTNYLQSGLALRFARKGSFIPNIEVKFPKDSLAHLSLQVRKKVLDADNHICVERSTVFRLPLTYSGEEQDRLSPNTRVLSAEDIQKLCHSFCMISF